MPAGQITRKFEFDSAHRVLGHESKCKHLHGHRYVAEVTVETTDLDALGRVIDFSEVKAKVGAWIDEFWDHNILLNVKDPLLYLLAKSESAEAIFAGKNPFIVPRGLNPTAEVMAMLLHDVARSIFKGTEITVNRVRVYETPNCWADYPVQ